MAASEAPAPSSSGRLARTVRVIIVSSVMLTFLSYWRIAAVVLCDLASTSFYIGGIVESAIGKAAPWFILAVILFSYAVRAVYIESCSMFVRGGVYRVVKEAMGGFLAKLSVSALMFDYVLTGPISGVSSGQYLVGLGLESVAVLTGRPVDPAVRDAWKAWGSAAVACLVTLYFFRQNLLGLHESSGKALKIMIATTVMAVVLLTWCGITLAMAGPRNGVPLQPDLEPRPDPLTGGVTSPLGFLDGTTLAGRLTGLKGPDWLSLIGLLGIFVAFGHSILAMSGEETLAQVYREVESPKLPNFKKAAFIVFLYSLVLTGGVSFLAVLLIPDDVRMKEYADNLIGGLSMSVSGPPAAKLLLHGFVVVVGFLILAGAVNTAIIGSNGVLNRVAEDGVLPEWFLKPHPRHGTTYRLLCLILGLQLFTILVSRGDVLALGEAYAFGVVWSFVFKALAMIVLRFKEPSPRDFKVPLNLRVGRFEVPIGLGLIFVILVVAAVTNLLTKETATKWGLGFTMGFLAVFLVSERYQAKRNRGVGNERLDQFNQQEVQEITPQSLELTKPYRRLVSIRSTHNLYMLERVLEETNPETTDVVVMHAKVLPPGSGYVVRPDLNHYDQELMTAVVERAEKAGKGVKPLLVPTNNAVHAILKTAKALQVQEVILGASQSHPIHDLIRDAARNRPAGTLFEQIADYWTKLHGGQPAPITVRVLTRDKEQHIDLGGGGRIPGSLPDHDVGSASPAESV
jgi:amino acid transporter